jgi:eukaryotic-like serine/threonine-protein kinase
MRDLTGMFWTDAEPQLRSLGWTGILVKGADVAGSDQQRSSPRRGCCVHGLRRYGPMSEGTLQQSRVTFMRDFRPA